jgi:hypothetical protein
MSLRRQQLSPVDGFDNRIDWQAAIDRWNQRAPRWALGPGLLSFHLTLFSLAFLTTLTWNLIADPADLGMIEPFRYWGVIAVVHTILVGGWMIGWKLLRLGEPEARRFTVPAAALPQLRADPSRTPAWQAAWNRSNAAASRVNTTARRWAAAPARRAEAPTPPRDAATGWPEQPPIFREAAAGPEAAESPAVDVGAATWPDSAPLSTTLSASAAPSPADELVSVDHRDEEGDDDQAKSWIDGFVESRSKDKDQRWSWVEAAAAAWLNRREVEGKTEKALSAGEEQAEAVVETPPPDESSQTETPTA